MRKFKKSEGITLVALIITIIVLLILAMVSIKLVINGGIIEKANNTVSDYKIAEEKEQIQLGYSDYQLAISMGQAESLKVEGATVTGEGPWTVTFINTEDVYTLSADGETITTEPSVQTFTFTIADQNKLNSITYTAEVGMTWQQWVNSSYNTDGAVIDDGYILNSNNDRAVFRQLQGSNVIKPASSEEIIQSNFSECFWGVDWKLANSEPPSSDDIQ